MSGSAIEYRASGSSMRRERIAQDRLEVVAAHLLARTTTLGLNDPAFTSPSRFHVNPLLLTQCDARCPAFVAKPTVQGLLDVVLAELICAYTAFSIRAAANQIVPREPISPATPFQLARVDQFSARDCCRLIACLAPRSL